METKTPNLRMRLRLLAEGTTGPEMAVQITSRDLLAILDERPTMSDMEFEPESRWPGTTRAALQAAITFLQDAEARDLLGLHRVRVGDVMMTRGQLADLLRTSLIGSQPREARQ